MEEAFYEKDWYPHQLRQLRGIYASETLSYLSNINRGGFLHNNHRACDQETGCVADNVDLENDNLHHTAACTGSCVFLHVDYAAIVTIIQAGGVPLISIELDAAVDSNIPNLRLRVIPRTNSSRYTVISHVWFDGLGNPSANALPYCQLGGFTLNCRLRHSILRVEHFVLDPLR